MIKIQPFKYGRCFIKGNPEIEKLIYKENDKFSVELKLLNDKDFDHLNCAYDGIPVYWAIKRGTAGVMIDVRPYPCPYFEVEIHFLETNDD